MRSEYIDSRRNICHIIYHIAWCSLYRQSILDQEEEEYLVEVLKRIAEEKGFRILQTEITDKSCVSVYVQAPTTMAPADIVKHLKAGSSLKLLKKYPYLFGKIEERCRELNKTLGKKVIWNWKYLLETIGDTDTGIREAFFERHRTVKGG